MRRRAIASWAALLIVLTLLTAGCADTPAASSKAELIWAAGTPSDAAMAIADRWNDLHREGPRVRVEPIHGGSDGQHQLMSLELNAGLGDLDILELDVIWTAEFAQKGWLVDLAELRPDIERVSLPVAVQSAVWNGRLWAAPYTTDAGILYYRKDLVDKPPTTWEELRKVGFQIGEQEGIAPFVADGDQYEGMVCQYLEYFWGAGGDFDRFAPGFETMDHGKAKDVFQADQAVFMRSWPYVYRDMNKPNPDSQVAGNVGIAPLPTFAGSGSGRVNALGGHNLAVSRFSDNPSAAADFVHFVSTSKEVQRILAEHSYAPTLRETYTEMKGDPLIDLLDSVLPDSKPRPADPEWTTISEEMQQQIFAAYTGDGDPGPEIDALRAYLAATAEDR
jgi:multiple sugar transport system substrate-binding protein